MSFGFSVGDFVAALQLVGTVIDAIRDSGGSRTEYRELINELYGLETALLRVKQLEFEEDQRSEYIALRQAAAQCQTTIDAFCARIKKYQKSLRAEGSGSTLTDTVAKLQWKLCRKDDLIKFKTDISAHTQSIQILLAALQVVSGWKSIASPFLMGHAEQNPELKFESHYRIPVLGLSNPKWREFNHRETPRTDQ